MYRILVFISIILIFAKQTAWAECAYFLQGQLFERQQLAKNKADSLRHVIKAGTEVRMKALDGKHSYVVVNPAWTKSDVMLAKQQLAEQGFQLDMINTCLEQDHKPIVVPEKQASWPYVSDLARELKAVAEDAAVPKTHQLMSIREAILLGLRYAPDVKNAEIDMLIQKYNLRLVDWNFEWKYGLTSTAHWGRDRIEDIEGPEAQYYNLNARATRKTALGTDIGVSINNHLDRSEYSPNVELSLKQPLLKGAGREIILKEWYDAQDNETINRLNYRQSLMSRITHIIKNYRQLVVNNNDLITSKQALEESTRTFEHNKVQIRLGRMAKTVNVPQASQVESNRLSLEQTQNSIEQSKQSLLQSIGLDPDVLLNTPDDVSISKKYIPDMQETIEYALKHNVDYQIKLINLKKTKRDLAKARDNERWQLDLDAKGTVGGSIDKGVDASLKSLVQGRNRGRSVGLTLTVPIDNKDLKYAVAKERLRLEKEKNNLYKAKRDLITQVKNIVINIRSQVKQLTIAERALKLARETYDVTLKRQQLGRASSLDVTSSQNDLVRKRINLIRTKVNYLNALSELDLNLGRTLERWSIEVKV